MKKYLSFFNLLSLTTLLSCNAGNNQPASKEKADKTEREFLKGTFGYDLNFLKYYHKDLITLGEDSTGAQVIVLPAYQGRVMTSSTEGKDGASFGWVYHVFIASG